jgi:hypothetical protein
MNSFKSSPIIELPITEYGWLTPVIPATLGGRTITVLGQPGQKLVRPYLKNKLKAQGLGHGSSMRLWVQSPVSQNKWVATKYLSDATLIVRKLEFKYKKYQQSQDNLTKLFGKFSNSFLTCSAKDNYIPGTWKPTLSFQAHIYPYLSLTALGHISILFKCIS